MLRKQNLNPNIHTFNSTFAASSNCKYIHSSDCREQHVCGALLCVCAYVANVFNMFTCVPVCLSVHEAGGLRHGDERPHVLHISLLQFVAFYVNPHGCAGLYFLHTSVVHAARYVIFICGLCILHRASGSGYLVCRQRCRYISMITARAETSWA